jgi:hypothetical protein
MRIVVVSSWLFLLVSLSPLSGRASGFSCPTASPVPATGTGERKADVDAAVSLFEGMMGPKLKAPPFSAKFKADYHTTQNEIMSKYPNADKLALGQQELAIGCGLIKESSLTDAEKLKQYNLLLKEINNFMSPSRITNTGGHAKATSIAPSQQVPGYVGGNYCPNGNCPSNTSYSVPPPPELNVYPTDEWQMNAKYQRMPGMSAVMVSPKSMFRNPAFLVSCSALCVIRGVVEGSNFRTGRVWDDNTKFEVDPPRRAAEQFKITLADGSLVGGALVRVDVQSVDGQPVSIVVKPYRP